jgi:hypothetical protein
LASTGTPPFYAADDTQLFHWAIFARFMVRKGLTVAASLPSRPACCCVQADALPSSRERSEWRGGVGWVGGLSAGTAASVVAAPPHRRPLRKRRKRGEVKQCRPLAQPRDLATRFARAMPETFRPLVEEGAGNAGRPMRPIAACAILLGRSAHALVRSHRNHPAFPTQWFTAYSALSPGTGLSCPRH